MTQVYHFTIVASVEASSPLKVLSFLSESFINHELLFIMNYNAWANFSMSLYQVTLFYVSFTQLQQRTEFTMNDVEHYLMWTLWNYIIVNFTWILNDIWMDVKWFEWNFNKTVQRMKY